jgi:hypothetical protein
VRELVGYLRFDTDAELTILNRIWDIDTSYLLARLKLMEKQHHGAKVSKRYDRATTAFGRASAWASISRASRTTMDATTTKIHPSELCPQIRDFTERLEHMAVSKTRASVKPMVNRAFNS